MYKFSATPADEDEKELWALQTFLLTQAEGFFGVKNANKKIYHPTFEGDKPNIVNTPNLDGSFASLSQNARKFWPTTLYELAHETVHLLDPVVGCTNYLEEGFSVLFSIDMSKTYTEHPQAPTDPIYIEALALVTQLSNTPYDAAKMIRNKFGSLGAAEVDGLHGLFPTAQLTLIKKLCSACNFE